MNYPVQIDSLRNRIEIFEYQEIPKSTAVMIHNSLVNSYKEIDRSMTYELESLKKYGVFASSLCVSKMNIALTLRNASTRLLNDPIEIEYQQTINKSEIRYEYSMMVLNYLDFYSDMLSSAARELDKIAKVINSRVE